MTKTLRSEGLTQLNNLTIACKHIGTSRTHYKLNVYDNVRGENIGYLLKEENIIKRMCKDYSFNVNTYDIDGYLRKLADQLEEFDKNIERIN